MTVHKYNNYVYKSYFQDLVVHLRLHFICHFRLFVSSVKAATTLLSPRVWEKKDWTLVRWISSFASTHQRVQYVSYRGWGEQVEREMDES